jgi:hypothetical protein
MTSQVYIGIMTSWSMQVFSLFFQNSLLDSILYSYRTQFLLFLLWQWCAFVELSSWCASLLTKNLQNISEIGPYCRMHKVNQVIIRLVILSLTLFNVYDVSSFLQTIVLSISQRTITIFTWIIKIYNISLLDDDYTRLKILIKIYSLLQRIAGVEVDSFCSFFFVRIFFMHHFLCASNIVNQWLWT